jgi:phosphoglycerate dehydrogenase-like enzyme
MKRVAVTSRSFSNHAVLRETLSQRYEHVVFNDAGKTLAGAELVEFLKNYEMAILGLERMDATILNQLPNLKVISRFGVGLDTLDLAAMQELGIKLAYTAGANKRAVAELVIAFAITMLRNLPAANQEVRNGVWKQHKGRQLSNCKVGIIGLGAVGKDLVTMLNAFGCEIVVYDTVENKEFCHDNNLKQVDLETLLKKSDVVTLHIPHTKDTHFIIDEERLSLMKANAILINTARGGLVDENALKTALINNKLAGAAFDVFATEPPQDLELLTLSNFFATPHIGGTTQESILAMGLAAIEGLEQAKSLVGYDNSIPV